MLSGEDIKKALEAGELSVDPLFEGSVRPAGLRLHLGPELLRPRPGKVVDVSKGIYPDYDQFIITEDNPYELQPGEFLLAATFEKVTVGASLGFLIEGRSTLARIGLTIVQTAMLVYPGHTARPITLEFANHGPNPILLYPRMKIARAAIFELKSPTLEIYDTTGKYRGQDSVGPPIFKDEIVGLGNNSKK